MKVKELIEQLKQCDPETVVCDEVIDYERAPSMYYEVEEIVKKKDSSYYDTQMKVQSGDIVVIK